MGPIQAKRQATKINALGTRQHAEAFQVDWAERGWAVRCTDTLRGNVVESDTVHDTEIWIATLQKQIAEFGLARDK